MTTAAFGADATGTYQTPNFVTAQEGVQERSTETLLQTAGSATQQGYGITAAFKGREFRGEIDAAVQTEIGKQFASNVEPQPADVQEFKDAIERAKQVSTQGGLGARMRTNLLAEKLTREKAGASPLFASVYRQVAQEVLGDYEATLQFMDMAEAAAVKQAKAAQTGRDKLISNAYGMFKNTGAPFSVPFEQMTDEQLQRYSIYASKYRTEKEKFDRDLRIAADTRAEMSTQATIMGANAQVAQANLALATSEQNRADSEMVYNISSLNFGALDQLTKDQMDSMRRGATPEQVRVGINDAFRATRAKMNEQFNEYEKASGGVLGSDYATRKREAFADVDRIEQSYINYFTGSLSELQTNADALKTLTTGVDLNIAKVAPNLFALKQLGGANLVTNALTPMVYKKGFINLLEREAKTGMNAYETYLSDYTNLVTGNADMNSLSANRMAVQREGAGEMLRSKNPTNPVSQDSGLWLKHWNNFSYGLDDMNLTGADRKTVFDTVVDSNFVINFQKAQASNPGAANIVASRLHAKAEDVGASYKQLLDKRYDYSVTPEGYFIVSDKNMEQKLNSFLDALVVSRVGDRRAPNNEDQARLYFMQQYFGLENNSEVQE